MASGGVRRYGTAGGSRGRVCVAVRLRPRNSEEKVADAGASDCVELQPEFKRLKLHNKNNQDFNMYKFDEVLTEFASQKSVYEVVAKPVVESVLEGCHGTVMAYGQTGTGKTYTLGQPAEEDTEAKGIMVRSMVDILANISPETGSVSVAYLQLYMETIRDLVKPRNINIRIVEDPKTGEISVPEATLVEIRDQHSFLEVLRIGEAQRLSTTTKMSTDSSRSHAIMMVHVKRSVEENEAVFSGENGIDPCMFKRSKAPLVRKGKLFLVDLAGSEWMEKSGSEGKTLEEAKSINLSLTALGKCINALAENSSHVPVRDSKLTRLLKGSFGGMGRTSLIVTIGPSPRHRGETASTIMFGQRAMKVKNMVRINEEFDYKSLSRKLYIQLDELVAEHERQKKAFQDELERKTIEAQSFIADGERSCAEKLENEQLWLQKDHKESVKKLEEQWVQRKLDDDRARMESKLECAAAGSVVSTTKEFTELKQTMRLEKNSRKAAKEEVESLRSQIEKFNGSKTEESKLRKMLEDEGHRKEKLKAEIKDLKRQLLQLSFEVDESQVKQLHRNGLGKPEAKLSGQVEFQKAVSLLHSEDAGIKFRAVKKVANLAAKAKLIQEKSVEAWDMASLLMLLKSSENENTRGVAASAIANLAVNETNQKHIIDQGGIILLSMTAADVEEPDNLFVVAAAIANLCGSAKFHTILSDQGGVKALLGMVKCGHQDVLAEVARGIANFAKCESRASTQGIITGRSILLDDGALSWILQNAKNEASQIRGHIQLALCHLAQCEVNAKDMISGGALHELLHISLDCSEKDIKTLATQTLKSSPTFQSELQQLKD